MYTQSELFLRFYKLSKGDLYTYPDERSIGVSVLEVPGIILPDGEGVCFGVEWAWNLRSNGILKTRGL